VAKREKEREGKAQKREERRERLGKRAPGAARLTNRSIVGGKTIRSLTSLDLDPALSSSLLFSLFPSRARFPHTCIYANRAPAERGESALPLSNLSCVRKSWPPGCEGDLYKGSGLLCAAGRRDRVPFYEGILFPKRADAFSIRALDAFFRLMRRARN